MKIRNFYTFSWQGITNLVDFTSQFLLCWCLMQWWWLSGSFMPRKSLLLFYLHGN